MDVRGVSTLATACGFVFLSAPNGPMHEAPPAPTRGLRVLRSKGVQNPSEENEGRLAALFVREKKGWCFRKGGELFRVPSRPTYLVPVKEC